MMGSNFRSASLGPPLAAAAAVAGASLAVAHGVRRDEAGAGAGARRVRGQVGRLEERGGAWVAGAGARCAVTRDARIVR